MGAANIPMDVSRCLGHSKDYKIHCEKKIECKRHCQIARDTAFANNHAPVAYLLCTTTAHSMFIPDRNLILDDTEAEGSVE